MSPSWPQSLRAMAGCWVHERWRTELAVRGDGPAWAHICNRNERVRSTAHGSVVCDWNGSSMLTVSRVFPRVGARLLRRCLQDWPLNLQTHHSVPRRDFAVVLPVAGAERMPAVRAVLAAFAGQTGGCPEVIVVEHSEHSEYSDICQAPVRYLHLPRAAGAPFNKSRAINAGVRLVSGSRLLLHDADALPPAGLCDALDKLFEDGFEGATPARFLFLLDRLDSANFIASLGHLLPKRVSEVMQNFPGLCQAVTRTAYEAVGGYDERFEGWGGEDEEFLQRLRTRRFLAGGFAPMIHLWHSPAPKKASGDRNRELSRAVFAEPPAVRIRRLLQLNGA